MYVSGKFTAKRGRFKGLNDDLDTWRDLYTSGGEELLREYSEHMLTVHDFFAKKPDAGFMSRLCIVLTAIWLSPEQFWHFAFERLSERNRYFLCLNKHCPEDLIEAIWIGDYYCGDGTSDPDAVAAGAYFNNYRKALSIYAGRPDLRYVLDEALRKQYEFSLRYEGIVPIPDDVVNLGRDVRKLN